MSKKSRMSIGLIKEEELKPKFRAATIIFIFRAFSASVELI